MTEMEIAVTGVFVVLGASFSIVFGMAWWLSDGFTMCGGEDL